ncbi:inositol polyphosphate 1-phosphatase [Diaphorina citri]|uniref:Inositol polyphosphate 1-phosphatase n=1 Tax=Diaphorina citri TaxID=121845 RepID=A0A3Q0J1P7_DIACI|nr:inositol polyphosphate 1-phosphatase [Diaphorina citri]
MEPNLLKEILIVSEKAANIARICRQDEHLLRLLTQEKSEEEKNQRFAADFKTLADVLIQEVVKQQLTTKSEGEDLREHGGTSSGNEGEDVRGDSGGTSSDNGEPRRLTYDRYEDRCNRNGLVAYRDLDTAVRIIAVSSSENSRIRDCLLDNGYEVLPLPGAGYKILSVILNKCDVYLCSKPSTYVWDTLIIAVSSSENSQIRDCLLDNGYEVLPLPGAGYKILSVILNKCDVYLCSKPSTYVWDTLACQAILESMTLGGSIVECRGNCEGSEGEDSRGDRGGSLPESEGEDLRGHGGTSSGNEGEDVRGDSGGTSSDNGEPRRLTYDRYQDRCNKNGLVAYRDLDTAVRVLKQIDHLLPR